MYLRRFIFSILILFPLLLSAQDSLTAKTSKIWGVKLGAAHAVLRDDFLMPLNYIGAGGNLGGFYERNKNKTLQEAGLDMHFSSMHDRLGFEALYTYSSFRYSYTWQFTSDSNTRIKAFAGPITEAQYNFYYFPQTDDSHLRWLTQYQLGAHVICDINTWKERKLRLSANVPFFRFCSRMPQQIYNSNFNPAFGKVISMIHTDMRALLGAGGWRFNASFPVIQTQKNILEIGYEHFFVSYNHAFMQTNSLNLKLARRK